VAGKWRTLLPAPLAAATLGFALVGSVVSWMLFASTYARDVDTICNAEVASGFQLDRDMARVTQWIRERLATRQGGALFALLRDEPVRRRGHDLRAEAAALALKACPLAQSYDEQWAQAEYRADLQRLCSRYTFPGIADLAPAARVQRLAEWLDTEAGTAKARALASPLRFVSTGREGVSLLREAATQADLPTCDVGGMLEAEAPLSCH
jgi:hypothetical protein